MYADIFNASLQELLSALDDNDAECRDHRAVIAIREQYLRELREERNAVIRHIDEFHGGYEEDRG